MKKTFLGLALLTTLISCSSAEKVQECKQIAEKSISGLNGYTIDNMDHVSRVGLKLAVPSEYESSTAVTTISYKNSEENYKGCTCYYNSKGELMGSSTY